MPIRPQPWIATLAMVTVALSACTVEGGRSMVVTPSSASSTPAPASREAESAFVAEVREEIVGRDGPVAGAGEPRSAPDMPDDEWLTRGYRACGIHDDPSFYAVADENQEVWGLLSMFNTTVLASVAGEHLCPKPSDTGTTSTSATNPGTTSSTE